jgi:hypothetical protein
MLARTFATSAHEVQLQGSRYQIEVIARGQLWTSRLLQDGRVLAECPHPCSKAGAQLWACWRAHWEADIDHPGDCPICRHLSRPRDNA